MTKLDPIEIDLGVNIFHLKKKLQTMFHQM